MSEQSKQGWTMPDAIIASEKAGQAKFNASDILPRDMRGITVAELEGLGFVMGEHDGGLFIEAKLPPGWTKRDSSHDMWSDILDETETKRASVFYATLYWGGV